ncbi:MAG: hypothetical protein A3I44_04325 [Candidatus Sungbacteria bacterium RIFCSPLOWO2_02_FULL_51_17]|uniref:Non-canonical purine NTP pyrophosphatase n=1 Tax=Candidatus Sungbacteria bacterium RIFCSPHIGHO2_02_FULL_51_29 TaxID=1802273 RepID=A0A1G2KW58_9BACT|nr:MAG: hypothetical protein A2676_05905 [Candidatus Sungbacteria bacterium RIFCSPHIGHO2_01_FULL_51_22]OHA03677.1 MAG: hypothetical protein A3C16_03505 [Candidatus Sungbacteria bacterium RIFCSPHIGHO2_02_FULL_51_29]OHA07423.1 MAG: hypothetical protein A3B29_04830 [Candidatus Sungbacteria bacterium RIFCSPLOWO2_01_FULL_51_34]OHA11302.1 MAG: hypothetical protein A3I44_04325 [Candidatus Sungbacteria bacterium RIFCSPLOWO2_02_FULL_51_17]
MKKLLLASTNPGKIEEYRRLLGHLPIDVISLKDQGISMAVDEDGKTFEDNAIKKAILYHSISGLPTLADDGGIEIDHLRGEPGVLSRRWPGYEASDDALIEMTLERMRGVPKQKRTAKLRVAVALVFPGEETVYTAEAEKKGILGTKPIHPVEGYPYRSLFYLPELKKNYSELTRDEELSLAHRKEALDRLMPVLKKKFL